MKYNNNYYKVNSVPIFFTIISLSSSISPCTLAMLPSFPPDSEYRFCELIATNLFAMVFFQTSSRLLNIDHYFNHNGTQYLADLENSHVLHNIVILCERYYKQIFFIQYYILKLNTIFKCI